MGSGTWNRASFDDYSRRAGRRVSASGDILGNFSKCSLLNKNG